MVTITGIGMDNSIDQMLWERMKPEIISLRSKKLKRNFRT